MGSWRRSLVDLWFLVLFNQSIRHHSYSCSSCSCSSCSCSSCSCSYSCFYSCYWLPFPAAGKISLGPHSFDPSDSRCDPKMSSGKDKVLRVHLKTQAYNSVKTIRVADKAKNVEIIKEVCLRQLAMQILEPASQSLFPFSLFRP